MPKSWELNEDQKKEIQEKQAEIGAEYDPETGRKKGQTENTGDNEDVEATENIEHGKNREIDDDNVR